MDEDVMVFTAELGVRKVRIEVSADSAVEDLQEVWEALLVGLSYQHESVRAVLIQRGRDLERM
jgi:hypothetical protein